MKPIKLKISGLNSFIAPQTVDFEELGQNNLFCISGSTGSGKTTVVDAIILALYGDTKRGNLEEVVNLSCSSAIVELTIELEGSQYVIYREIRKSGANKVKLFGENEVIIAENATAVNDFIKSKIGLDKDQFTKVVMLQQGEFDKFLSDGKTDRMRTIEKLTDISKYQKAIAYLSVDEKEAELETENDKKRLEEYADVSDEILEQKQKEIDEITCQKNELSNKKQAISKERDIANKKASDYAIYIKREKDINELSISLKDIENQKIALEKEKEEAKTLSLNKAKIDEEIAENNTKTQAWAECKGIADTLENYKVDIQKAIEEYLSEKAEKEKCEKELLALEKEKSIIEKEYGFTPLLAVEDEKKAKEKHLALTSAYNIQQGKIKDLESKKKQREQIVEELSKNSLLHSKITSAENKLRSEYESIKNERDKEQAKLEKMKNDDMLSAVLSTVKVGDKCPICGTVVTSLSHIEKQDFGEIEEKIKKLNEDLEKAQNSLLSNKTSLASILADYENLTKNKAKVESEIDSLQSEIGQIISLEEVEKAEKKSSKASVYLLINSNYEKQKELVGNKIADLEKRAKEGQELRQRMSEREESLNQKCGTSQVKEIEKNIDLLKNRNEELNKELKKIDEFVLAVSQQQIKIAVEEKAKSEQLDKLKKEHIYCEKVDQEVLDDIENRYNAIDKEYQDLVAKEAKFNTEKIQLTARNEQRKALANALENKIKRYDLLKELKSLVKGVNFTEFLLDAFMEDVTEEASTQMAGLSNDQYTLYYEDGKFFVRDYFNGNEGRNVNTLSGGERFLASLSLAIAISRRTAQSKDYGFFFIDEGFGTLDENSINTVYAALENLAKDTMVGVITHRKELIERVPSVLEVIKTDPEKGSVCKIKM